MATALFMTMHESPEYQDRLYGFTIPKGSRKIQQKILLEFLEKTADIQVDQCGQRKAGADDEIKPNAYLFIRMDTRPFLRVGKVKTTQKIQDGDPAKNIPAQYHFEIEKLPILEIAPLENDSQAGKFHRAAVYSLGCKLTHKTGKIGQRAFAHGIISSEFR